LEEAERKWKDFESQLNDYKKKYDTDMRDWQTKLDEANRKISDWERRYAQLESDLKRLQEEHE